MRWDKVRLIIFTTVIVKKLIKIHNNSEYYYCSNAVLQSMDIDSRCAHF